MKCATSCATYDAWLEPSTDWQAANPCDGCLQVGVVNCLNCIENGAKLNE
jgi:hypothetical protein